MFIGVVLAALCVQAVPPDGGELVELPSPIVVETAPSVLAGPEFEPDPEIQEAMEAHAAELRAERARADEVAAGLPAGLFAAATTGITVSYNSGFPAPSSVRAVVDAAVGQWDSVIATNPAGPVVVEVYWSNLGNASLLGYAGPDGMFYSGGLPDGALYPAALANTLLGVDANGPSRPEIQVVLNAELLSSDRWYLGTTGSPPSGKIDLYSVVLHEVGHGLGFLGSANVPSGSSSPALHDPPYAFDTVTSHGTTRLTDVGDQSAALLSGDVHAEVSDGMRYELYAPASWTAGSSFSHFDEHGHPGGTAGALMTPMLGSGETARILDSPTLGVMARIGWPLTVAATTPTITSLSPSLTSAVVSWDQNLWKSGVAPDRYVIEAWRDGTTLQSTATFDGSATGGAVGSLSPGVSYTIKVVPWGPNGNGAAAQSSVTLSSAGGPADPSEWPSFIRDLPLDGQINRLYQAYFLRLADQSGFDYWLGQRAGAASLADISAAFAASAEFENRYGSLSDQAFVDLVYANVLNRVGDTGGRAYWMSQLQSGVSRGQVMIGFAESAEYVTRTGTAPATDTTEARITRLYQAFFLRSPDGAGLQYWSDQARSGASLESIAVAFAGSPEFQSRYGSLDDGAFVHLVYTNVLGREPDGGGLAYWSGLLASGVDRGTVMVGFSESPEFIRSTGTIP